MRRDAFRKRLFFLLVLAGALLLLSALMLRHESAALSTRTFRDGFTVAEDVMRRTEIVATSNTKTGSATKVPPTENLKDYDRGDLRTTTVKTEDGDEIIIKRPAMSKGSKVTTIFRDEKGKLTIEDTTAEEIQREDTDIEAEKGEGQNPLDNIPVVLQEDADTIRRDKATGEEAVLVSSGKKVTLVEANRLLTEVGPSDVEDSVDKEASK